jgi:flavin reductase (DIM6/NTAB) family NADH-FMN oxidoreductase RutF
MEIDLNALEARHAHDLLTSALIPRPIAWVSTVNAQGQANIAPFSFFTGVSWSPPVLAVSVVTRPDGTFKDTLVNIRETGEFVVNLVSVDLREAMEETARTLPYGTDEAAAAGLHWAPTRKVRPQRIAEARIAFECTLAKIVAVDTGPDSGNLILGRMQLVHLRDGLLADEREVDWQALDPLGRLSGKRYCTVRDTVESDN